MTNSIDAVAATFPSTVAVPWPFPADEPSWSSTTVMSRTSPGTTWRRKRALSMPPKRGTQPLKRGSLSKAIPAQLGHGLDHQDPGQRGTAWEMSRKEWLLARSASIGRWRCGPGRWPSPRRQRGTEGGGATPRRAWETHGPPVAALNGPSLAPRRRAPPLLSRRRRYPKRANGRRRLLLLLRRTGAGAPGPGCRIGALGQGRPSCRSR